jgi:nicotinamide riboside kinase
MALEVASRWSPNVHVLMLLGPDDPLPMHLRVGWLQELAPRVGIVPLDLPSAAALGEGAPLAELKELLTSSPVLRPHALVGPGLRDRALARSLELAYLPVDVPGPMPSPEALRESPLRHWSHLPAPVRAHYARRVVVMGPESTGKTTLARELARRYNTVWTTEYLRVHLDAKQAECTPDDLPKVVAGHRATEAVLARLANRVLFCDTDPLMTAVYSRFYYHEVPEWLEAAAVERRAAHYLLLDADVPWVADPQRDQPHGRERILAMCREQLDRYGLPWTLLSGSWDERLRQACSLVDALFESPEP